MRRYAAFVEEHNLQADQITEDIMNRFIIESVQDGQSEPPSVQATGVAVVQ